MIRAGVIVLATLGACQFEEAPSEFETISPDITARERFLCEERGGRFGERPLTGGFVCYERTRDANQQCSTANDCEGLCLARSRSCAPIKPFFGCHEVLTASGAQATLCLD